ncbi:MAG: PASTA domain-containing protein [Acidimicrobiales bacterium]
MLAVAAAIAGLVFSVQHALDDQRVFDPTTIQLARGVGDVDPGSSGAGAAVDMPDVRDMKRDRALTIVGESGVPAGKITVEQVDQAGEADIVVNQDPAPGTNNPDAVTVYVSRPVAMPDYLNRAQKDVVTQLQQLGANPTIEYKFQAGTTEGAVLSQSVPAGSPMPADVSLVVAGQGAQVPIDLVQRVESDCSTGTESVIKGVTYPTSVECSVSYSSSSREPDRTTYVLSGEFDAVSVALGVTDDSTLGYQARLKVLVDGQVRAEQVLSPGGAPFVAVIPTTGAIQLSFEATFVGTPPSSSYPSVSAVFGSPTLLTSPDIAAKYQKGN